MIKRCFSSTRLVQLSSKPLPTNPLLPSKTNKHESSISQFFVDFKQTTISGGDGGDGRVSFMNTKEKAFAGPDGGDGGNGGHIIFKTDPNLKSLNKIKSRYHAESGVEGRSYHMKGKSGDHLEIKVPVGTLLKDQNDVIIHDLCGQKSKFIAARGGAGGKGNYYFFTNERRVPVEYEPGHKGQTITLNVELKLIADAALIGYPNVGKSSLLNSLTNARSKIGNYSFTTLYPHVGIVEYEDFQQISIADLPGLLPDLTRGFGTKYLQHLERCKMIILVIDLSLPEPVEQYSNMLNALNSFDPTFVETKPMVVVGNKIDAVNAKENLYLLKEQINGAVVPVSTIEKINLRKFMKILRDTYEQEIK